jgi:ribonuclease PH
LNQAQSDMSNKIKFVPLPLFPTSSRGATELREVDFRTGLVPEATGSCWYSAGSGAYSTKVCCCVLGPKPVKQVSLAGHVFSLIVSQRSGTEPRPLHHLCAAHRSSRATQKARMPSLHAMLNSPVLAAARACML